MGFGRKLKEAMDKKGVNAHELSVAMDVPPSTIYSMITRNSKRADVDVLIKIARYLGVSVDELLGSEETETVFPDHFSTAQEAMQFLLAQPAIMGFNGVDIRDLDDDTVLAFAAEILAQMKLVSFKYKKKE